MPAFIFCRKSASPLRTTLPVRRAANITKASLGRDKFVMTQNGVALQCDHERRQMDAGACWKRVFAMLLLIVAYLGGALTIVSPCILPVLPFVFARSDQPFRKSGLPLLLAMALTFAVIGTLAAFGGGWAVTANQWGRY